MSSSRSSLIGDSEKKEPITIRNVSNFGKYFILTPKFETIKEEDEELEAGSVSAPLDSRSRSEEFNDKKVDLDGEKQPNTDTRYYEPDELDEVMKV